MEKLKKLFRKTTSKIQLKVKKMITRNTISDFIKLMNDIYELSDENFNALNVYVQFLKWKQNRGE
jgi:hypothetical protein